MKFSRIIQNGPDRILLSVRNATPVTISIGGAVVWALPWYVGGTCTADAFGDAVQPPNYTGFTFNHQRWLLAGIVVESSLGAESWGLIQAYGAVDSVLVTGWTAAWPASFPGVAFRMIATTTYPMGMCTPMTWQNPTYGYDSVNPGALFAGASILNTSTAGDSTTYTSTAYIRGFIRAL